MTFTYEVVLVLLITAIIMTAFSAFLFSYLDQLVHVGLYRYGLQFSYEWAESYWIYARFLTESLAIAIVAFCISVVILLLNQQLDGINHAKHVCLLLLLIGIVAVASSAFFFSKLDYVVHNDLYRYGLSFSYEWAGRYWMYARSMLSLLGSVAVFSAVSIALMLTSGPAHGINPVLSGKKLLGKFNSANSVIVILFSSGVLTVAIAISVSSSVLALLGLGSLFWGVVLLYIKPGKYVKETVFEKTTVQLFKDLGHVIGGMGYRGRAVFLPPTLNDLESCRVYIGTKESAELPSPEDRAAGENVPFSRISGAKGILLEPTGVQLAKLIEEKIGKNSEKRDLEYLGQRLPKVLVEDLEIAQNVEIETLNPKFSISIKGSIYGSVCKETRKSSEFCTSVGCPLCSAIACVLAKSTRKPVIIEKDRVEKDGQIIDIEYRVL
jgi:hypothetical protein